MSYLHQKAANDLRGADVCAKELQVTRVALLRYRGVMAGVVRSMGVSGPIVEDVVHDAFEMACRKDDADRPDPKDEARFLGWLCALAKYAALTARNDSARSREVSSPTEELEDVPEPNRAYLGLYDDKVAAAVVFANLNPDDRKLLHEHFYEDKTVQELAVEQGIPWTTMRSRLDGVIHRARTIMDDKSYRRRGMGATALMWLVLSVSEIRLRLTSWWVKHERAVAGGLIGFVSGGAVVAALMHHADDKNVSVVSSLTAKLGELHTEALVPNVQGVLAPANATHLPAGFVPCSIAAQDVVVPAAAASAKKSIVVANAKPLVDVEDRARAIVPWSVAAVIRDEDHKRKK